MHKDRAKAKNSNFSTDGSSALRCHSPGPKIHLVIRRGQRRKGKLQLLLLKTKEVGRGRWGSKTKPIQFPSVTQDFFSPLPTGIAGGDGREGNARNRVVEALPCLPLGKLRVDVVEGEGVDQAALLALSEEGDEVTGRGTGDSH